MSYYPWRTRRRTCVPTVPRTAMTGGRVRSPRSFEAAFAAEDATLDAVDFALAAIVVGVEVVFGEVAVVFLLAVLEPTLLVVFLATFFLGMATFFFLKLSFTCFAFFKRVSVTAYLYFSSEMMRGLSSHKWLSSHLINRSV